MKQHATRTQGVTLVELLVVIAIIGLLAALLAPALQGAREASRSLSCQNKLRQLGIATQNYLSANRHFPAGTLAKPSPDDPNAAWTFHRWSALASLSPYLENTAVYDALDLSAPLYVGQQVNPVNAKAVRTVVPEFLCPSDIARRVAEEYGPTNYAFCTGSGGDGAPHDTDGISYENSSVLPRQILDGLSNTALASESILGQPVQGIGAAHDARFEYKFITSPQLSEARCELTQQWNIRDPRGYSWVNGEYRSAMYNHQLQPNAATPDCLGVLVFGPPEVRFRPYGWRTARSQHPGGVNLVMADGSMRFVRNELELPVWRGLSTIQGGEPK